MGNFLHGILVSRKVRGMGNDWAERERGNNEQTTKRTDVLRLLPHEIETASRLTQLGYQVDFLVPSNTSGVSTPDILLDGETWEIKSPKGAGKHTISHQLQRAVKQSSRLVLDLTRTVLDDDDVISEVVRRLEIRDNLQRVLVIRKDGSAVDLRKAKAVR